MRRSGLPPGAAGNSVDRRWTTPLSRPSLGHWRGGRVVECARLESAYTARYRGFESPPLRQPPPSLRLAGRCKRAGSRRLPAVGLAKAGRTDAPGHQDAGALVGRIRGTHDGRWDRHYVYLLRSAVAARRGHVGVTGDLRARAAGHNAGQNPSTVHGRPWRVVAHIVVGFRQGAGARTLPEERLRPDLRPTPSPLRAGDAPRLLSPPARPAR